MPGLRHDVDPDGLLEYSVVFTDRSLNSMSSAFQTVMKDLSRMLKSAYNADAVAIVPGGGTYGMEAIARQFAEDEHCLIIRNGWFSYRWTQILETGKLARSSTVLAASQQGNSLTAAFAPMELEAICARIAEEKPAVVFCPHVETSAGLMVPDAFIRQVADAVHAVGGIFVLDCVASGTVFVDMQETGVDVLLSAPQKGWSASPCSALIMLSARGQEVMQGRNSSSFSADLKKWAEIMTIYENGGHAYHTTMPTDALRICRDALLETEQIGFDVIKQAQLELGSKVRALLESHGFQSVAAAGFQAPSVVVSYTDDPEMKNGSKFIREGMQIAAGVPLECGEPEGFSTFRIGLFGLDKLLHPERTCRYLEEVLDRLKTPDAAE